MDKDRRETDNSIAIIGAGSWGTTIARVIADNHHTRTIRLWAYEQSVVKSISRYRINREFLPGVPLPDNIKPTNNIKECVSGASAIIIASPSKSVIDICTKIRKYLKPSVPIGFLSKGFCKYHHEILTISEAIKKSIPFLENNIVAISGPTHAEEVSRGYHTCICVAGKSGEARKIFTRLMSNDFLECRETDDISGVELGGTLKNPAAIAAGMISVLRHCGDNLTGALMAESLKEILRIGRSLGARDDTLIDISGCGDLVATSLSNHSRNRRFGIDIARQLLSTGKSIGMYDRILLRFRPEMVLARMTEKLHYLAEGAYAIEPLIEIAESKNIPIPVYRSLYEVLLNKKDPLLLIETIKNPDRYEELYKSTKIKTMNRKKGMEKTVGSVFSGAIARELVDRYLSDDMFKNEIQNFSDKVVAYKPAASQLKDDTLSFCDEYELKLLENIALSGSSDCIEELLEYYLKKISDRYSYIFFRIVWGVFYISRIFGFAWISEKKTSFRMKKNKALLTDLKELAERSNTVFLVKHTYMESFFPLFMALNAMGLPLPRFMRNADDSNTLRNKMLKLSGGFQIDTKKMVNPLYREAVMSYLSYYIGHGIPVLYFLRGGNPMDEAADREDRCFYNMIMNRIKKSTEEITLIPISFRKKETVKKNEKFTTYTACLENPFLVSDYANSSDHERELQKNISSILDRSSQ